MNIFWYTWYISRYTCYNDKMWLLKGEKCGIASTTSWLLSTSATASISSLPSWTPSGIALVRNICQHLGNTEYSKSMYDIFEGHIISLTLLVMRSNAAIRPLMRIVWNEKFCKKHLWDSPVSKFQKTSAQMLEKRAITLVTLVFEVQN